jgi:hypothetical protein
LIPINGWTTHLKEERLGAALPMHFSRKCGSTGQTDMRLEITPPAGRSAGNAFFGVVRCVPVRV